MPLGRVLKVDGAYAAVRFPTVGKDGKEIVPLTPDDWTTLLQDCRLVKKDDLIAVKWGAGGASGPRGPDCLQRTPRKISLPPEVQVITIAVSNINIKFFQIIIHYESIESVINVLSFHKCEN